MLALDGDTAELRSPIQFYAFILVQWEQNEGRCGVCGDAHHLKAPRPHEAGGEYGKGIISRRYAAGQVIN